MFQKIIRTEYEICEVCQKYDEVRRVKGKKQCYSCQPNTLESKADNINKTVYIKFTEDNEPPHVPVKRVIQPKPKPLIPARRGVGRPKLEEGEKPKKEKATKTLTALFLNNPDKCFTTSQIAEMLPQFERVNIVNVVCRLAREGLIYTRKINLGGVNAHILCGRNEDLVHTLIPEESAYKYLKFIRENSPTTNKALAKEFKRTTKSIGNLISEKLIEYVKIYRKGNMLYYYAVECDELEMIQKIWRK